MKPAGPHAPSNASCVRFDIDTVPRVVQELCWHMGGDIRFDDLSRTLYATDASMYEIVPLCVVLPADVDAILDTLWLCRGQGVSVVARGAGTGLSGGAVGPGVQLDLSRYMNQIGRIDPEARTVWVEPGVVLDELNAELARHGLRFGPDVATSSRATIGGMIANNSCGAHSIVHGRTVDHVLSLSVVLADGQVVTFGDDKRNGHSDPDDSSRVAQIERDLAKIRDGVHDEIVARFPKILRNNGGYGLDRLGPPGSPADAIQVLCGSEGTLGIVAAAKLRLIPIPKHTGLILLHFDRLGDALGVTPSVLSHDPAAVELIDSMVIEAGRSHPGIGRRCSFLHGDPKALLVVEFQDDDADRLASRMRGLTGDLDVVGCSTAQFTLPESSGQADVWELRRAGLGLLMSRPGDAQPHAFVEDTAVDPSRLKEYIERFGKILDREGVEAGYYAHASAGCIHVRPVLNLKNADDVERMRRIADAVSDLVLSFGGTMTGEHGDGIVRSGWLEKMYGPRIMEAFRAVKNLFDPDNLLNPNKIVDALPMTEHLRYGPEYRSQAVKTYLDFSAHGGLAGLAEMCSGVGQCRQRGTGTMCPSYRGTGDELHTTRARANALRVALSNRGLLNGLDDPSLEAVMDLCLACKACKTECPTGVDMARLKAEWLAQRNLWKGVSRRSRFVTDLPQRLPIARRLPGLANLVGRSWPVRTAMEYLYGLDRRVPPPRLARQTFRSWFDRHERTIKGQKPQRGPVVYFVDTWTNYFAPQVGIAAVTLLERAGLRVRCPRTVCCGRPAISHGLLGEARQLATVNVRRLAQYASAGIPILGTEPSCVSALVDEYPQLLDSVAAQRVSAGTLLIDTFLRQLLDRHGDALEFRSDNPPLHYHAHCHQKALVGSSDAVALLERVWGDQATEINSGCCGMAGTFGHEVEHYDVARAIGEQQLFPAVRDRGDANIAVSGFSCRTHIEHHTGTSAKHLVEYLAEALEPRPKH